jgi:hypothetical protein
VNDIVLYSVATGKLDRLGIPGGRPLWIPDTRGPAKIYSVGFDKNGKRIYFTQTIRATDLWMGQF